MKIGDNIKKFRMEKGMTQKELAEQIDRSLRMVQKYESGEVEPSIEVLNEIANVLGTDFLNFIEVKNAHVSLSEGGASLKQQINLSSELVKEIITSLLVNGELSRHIFIDDDYEILTNNIKEFIINQNNIISDKNSLILEALSNPDYFYNKYHNKK